jgi:hypothetical protein
LDIIIGRILNVEVNEVGGGVAGTCVDVNDVPRECRVSGVVKGEDFTCVGSRGNEVNGVGSPGTCGGGKQEPSSLVQGTISHHAHRLHVIIGRVLDEQVNEVGGGVTSACINIDDVPGVGGVVGGVEVEDVSRGGRLGIDVDHGGGCRTCDVGFKEEASLV